MSSLFKKSFSLLITSLSLVAIFGCSHGDNGAPAPNVIRVATKPSHDVPLNQLSLIANVEQVGQSSGQVSCRATLMLMTGQTMELAFLSGGDQILCNGVAMTDDLKPGPQPNTSYANGFTASVAATADHKYKMTFMREGHPIEGTIALPQTEFGTYNFSPQTPAKTDTITLVWPTELVDADKRNNVHKETAAMTTTQTGNTINIERLSGNQLGSSGYFFDISKTKTQAWGNSVTIEMSLNAYAEFNGMALSSIQATKKLSFEILTAH